MLETRERQRETERDRERETTEATLHFASAPAKLALAYVELKLRGILPGESKVKAVRVRKTVLPIYDFPVLRQIY